MNIPDTATSDFTSSQTYPMPPGYPLPPGFPPPPPSFPPPGFIPPPPTGFMPPPGMFYPPTGMGFPSVLPMDLASSQWETPYTGRPDPSTIPYQDPHTVNSGIPLHPLESLAPEGRTVYITNVPSIITESQLSEFLSVAGTITKIRLGREDHQPLRYAFVEYSSVRECHKAIGMSGIICCGRPLRIVQSKHAIQTGALVGVLNSSIPVKPLGTEESDRIERTVYVSNIPTTLSDNKVVDFLSLCGKILNYKFAGDTSQDTRFGFFEFETKAAAANCKAISGSSLGGFPLKCSDSKGMMNPSTVTVAPPANPNITLPTLSGEPPGGEVVARTVYVGNLDAMTTDQDLRTFFEEKCGTITKTNIMEGATDGYRYGFVEFQERNSANTAMGLSGQVLGTSIIRVAPSKGVIVKTPNLNLGTISNTGTQSLAVINNQAYALALQEENRKYQEYLARKQKPKKSKSKSPRRKRRRSRSRSRKGRH